MNKFHRSVTQKIFPDEPNHSEIVRFVLQIMFELVEALIHTEECSNRVKTHKKQNPTLGLCKIHTGNIFLPVGKTFLFDKKSYLPKKSYLQKIAWKTLDWHSALCHVAEPAF